MSDDKGVSGIYVNTEKGRQLLGRVASGIEAESVDIELSRMDNGGFRDPEGVPERREEFFKGMHSCDDIIRYMKAYVVRKPLWKRMYRAVRGFLSSCKKNILK